MRVERYGLTRKRRILWRLGRRRMRRYTRRRLIGRSQPHPRIVDQVRFGDRDVGALRFDQHRQSSRMIGAKGAQMRRPEFPLLRAGESTGLRAGPAARIGWEGELRQLAIECEDGLWTE